jgi:CBS domain-containing protein
MVKHASLLGDRLDRLMVPAEKAHHMLALPIDLFVLPDVAVINSAAPVFKALAVMEKHDTTYLFVVDGDEYHGTVSIMGIGSAVLEYGEVP